MRLREKDLYDPTKMKLDPRILEKLREVNQKISNYQRAERMKEELSKKNLGLR